MTVHRFWPTVHIRRIWTVFAGGAEFVSQQQQVVFCSFWSIFVSRASSYSALPLLPFSIDACVLHLQLILLVVMAVKLPFALKKALFWPFWLEAGLAP
jgi:hypothetical protein